jgi:hypothetical protein
MPVPVPLLSLRQFLDAAKSAPPVVFDDGAK